MYGSKIDEEGKELRADGSMPLMTGEQVPGHVIEGLFKGKDKDGAEVDNRWEIHFRQTNGKLFSYSFFNSEESWAQVATNRTMLHICTKIVSESDYYAAVAGCVGFHDFMNRIKTNIIPKATGKTFTLKIVYTLDKKSGNWYPKFPKFPNFIELDNTTPTTMKTDPKYDIYEIPSPTNAASLGASVMPGAPTEDVF